MVFPESQECSLAIEYIESFSKIYSVYQEDFLKNLL